MTHARRKQAIVGVVGLAALGAGYTIAIDPKGKPSAARSVAELNRVWSALR